MKRFASLIEELDSTTKTNQKVAALARYFEQADEQDKLWTIAILSHRRPPRPVNTTLLRQYAAELAEIPLWLFEDSYHIVGDLAESIALIIPQDEHLSDQSLSEILEELILLKAKPEEEKKAYVQGMWLQLDYYARFVFTKLLTGSFRIGISQKLMTKALSKVTAVPEDELAYRLMGEWSPGTSSFEELIFGRNEQAYVSKPYPFYLAYALEDELEALGEVSEWAIEHKWDGIRGQVICRKSELFIWSRGDELVTDKYPEISSLEDFLPDGTVIDGEILPFIDGQIGLFNDLQTRIGRKNLSKSILAKVPVIFKSYDLLEFQGNDIRTLSYSERRKLLEGLVTKTNHPVLQLSAQISPNSWQEVVEERALARERRSEGLMLKRKSAAYRVGRKKGDWWKWKTDPLSIDAVLTYAMRGHGRRTNLFTDYTFGLWERNENGEKELVTFAKAYSGLTDKEFAQVDNIIKRTTLERFGPVRSVEPTLVFELAFEGIAFSKRHKSGVAVRFPRIVRWRKDKSIYDADTLDDLKALIPK
ncbi:ATP-dependent DNA ligase [Algoriphagus halophytocola]|uniref:DNA ligase (ATP) n=1 Tax=Algoriphagus halophytocola TaxID=2991499 RepID=A0ABY6MIF2_9BACT|nr:MULTISPECIES: ATP-dependent DNA ligase [unclassified Algoriphagus]UZD23570.1 ATP-dependent DNA ligase [Algoriphagus sp. TR-M5]WBL44864.1 ATP-dependent DNA ligase [Algoriphagus sp. TR-M9]